jgi:antitoxin CptB
VNVIEGSAATEAATAYAAAHPAMGLLRWRCRRGMKELDVLLERFAQQVLPLASQAQCRVFVELLALPDPLLAGYLLRGEPPAEPHLAQAVREIRALCRLDDGSGGILPVTSRSRLPC